MAPRRERLLYAILFGGLIKPALKKGRKFIRIVKKKENIKAPLKNSGGTRTAFLHEEPFVNIEKGGGNMNRRREPIRISAEIPGEVAVKVFLLLIVSIVVVIRLV